MPLLLARLANVVPQLNLHAKAVPLDHAVRNIIIVVLHQLTVVLDVNQDTELAVQQHLLSFRPRCLPMDHAEEPRDLHV